MRVPAASFSGLVMPGYCRPRRAAEIGAIHYWLGRPPRSYTTLAAHQL
jgi:hypothetical protein